MKKIVIKAWFFMVVFSSELVADDIFTNEFESLVASRLNALTLIDPHIFENVPFIGCVDLTDNLNMAVDDAISNDDDGDLNLDLSTVTQFSSDQPNYIVSKSLSVQLINANCPDPLFAAACTVNQISESNVPTSIETINDCLLTEVGSTSSDYPAVINTSAPCYVTQARDVELDFGTFTLPLEAYQQAAQYTGGLTLSEGLHKGFVSEDTANNTIVPEITIDLGVTVTLFGGPLSTYLRSPNGQCFTDPALDDRDLGPDGITSGWWFYFNSESDWVELH